MNQLISRWFCEPCFATKEQLIKLCSALTNENSSVILEYFFKHLNQNTKKIYSISIFQIITYHNNEQHPLKNQLQSQLITLNKKNCLKPIQHNELSLNKKCFNTRSLIPLRIYKSIPKEVDDRFIFTFSDDLERVTILKNYEYFIQNTPFTHFLTIAIGPNFPNWAEAMNKIAIRWGIGDQVKAGLTHITIALFVIQNNDELNVVNRIISETIKEINWPKDSTLKTNKISFFGSPKDSSTLFVQPEKNFFIQALYQFTMKLISKLQDNGFGYFAEESQSFHVTILRKQFYTGSSKLDSTKFIQDINEKELPDLHIQELCLVQRFKYDSNGFYKSIFRYNIYDVKASMNNNININTVKIEHKSNPSNINIVKIDKPNPSNIMISKPKKKEISFTFSKSPSQQIQLETVTGRTFDSSPFFLLKINSCSFYFNMPEMAQRCIMAKYHNNYPSPQNIFITSLFPDSVGGLSHFFLQNYNNFGKLYSITGPKDLLKVILLDTDYFGSKIPNPQNLIIRDDCDDKFIKAMPIVLSKSISYDVLIKSINQRFLVVDCRSINDLSKLPNLNEYSLIIHLTIPEILIQDKYTSFFTSFNQSDDNESKNNDKNQNILNICFMPSGIISNLKSQKYYTTRANSLLQPLSYGKTLKAPKGFINFTATKSKFDFISKEIFIEGQEEEVEIDFNDIISKQNNNSQDANENPAENNTSNTNEDNDDDTISNFNSLSILSKLIEFEPSLPDFQSYAVTFLGSGTKFVSPTVNLSGYLIHTKYGFGIFDPSEGFFDQLKRKFGPRLTEYILKNIEFIWISHFHQDHILGAPTLLYERAKLTNKRIYFFAPQKFINDLQVISAYYGDFYVNYHNREPLNYASTEDLSSETIGKDDGKSAYEQYKADGTDYLAKYSPIPDSFEINEHLTIQSINVSHVNFSKGCLLFIDGDRKIAFSGDHGYKKDYFAKEFQNCDLLIHEATFPEKVRAKIGDIINHCYLSEAIDTAKYMNARITCLTHFSQRYDSGDLMYRISDNIMLAFDFLEFSSENAIDVFKICSQINDA